MARGRALLPFAVIAALAMVPALPASPASATGPTVTGAGSTWVQIALDQWRADFAQQGYSINYQGVGSSAGREFYIINQVDFAASEIPFQPDEVAQLQAEGKSYQYMPDVAGGTSLMYNLHSPAGSRVTSLRLDADTSAKIFTGGITSWQDPAIQALNPGLEVRETTIIPVIRSDGSGTSAQFSLYLQDQAPSTWNAFVSAYGCPAPCSLWPPFPGSTQQKGSDGVANFVANDAIGSGSIGYVEAGYAFGRGFPVASLKNASGSFTQPTSDNVSTALAHATLNADLTQNLTGVYRAPETNAYPMSSYSYMITQTTGFDPSKGAVLGAWIIYIACAGQREAAPLGYSPLPPNLVQADFEALARIPGAPTAPPIDKEHCPNPTVTNSGESGGGNGNGNGSGGGNGGGSGSGSGSGDGGGAPTPTVPGSGTAGTTPAASGTPLGGTGGGSGSFGYGGQPTLPPGVQVETLDATEREASFERAKVAARDAHSSPALPLVVASLVVILAVLGPMLFEWRGPNGSRLPSAPGDRHEA